MNDFVIGLIAVMIASIAYGCEYEIIKKYDLRDGVYVGWLRTVGCFMGGSIVFMIRAFPPFNPYAALGGIIFATSNAIAVPILNLSGILGFLVWGSLQIVLGWGTARFGLFGLNTEPPGSVAADVCEYMGIAITILSVPLFGLVKCNGPESNVVKAENGMFNVKTGLQSTLATISSGFMVDGYVPQKPAAPTSSDYIPPSQNVVAVFVTKHKTLIGIVLASFAAVISSQSQTPVTYAQQESTDPNINGLDMAFSFACGVFFMGTIYFAVYSAIMKNRPNINIQLTIPGICHGLCFSLGHFGMFFANGKLSQALPALIMMCWDVFFWKRITGKRNLIILSVAATVSVIGVTLIGLADAL